MTENVNPTEQNGTGSEASEPNTTPVQTENTSPESTAPAGSSGDDATASAQADKPVDSSDATSAPAEESSAPATPADAAASEPESAKAETAPATTASSEPVANSSSTETPTSEGTATPVAPAATATSEPVATSSPAATPASEGVATSTAPAATASSEPAATPANEGAATSTAPAATASSEPAATPASEGAATPAASAEAPAGEGEAGEAKAEPEPEPKMSLEEMRPIWDELTAKKDSRELVDVVVTGVNRGGVVSEYKGVEIFVPLSHWSIDRSANMPDAKTGDPVQVYVLEISHFDTDARRVTGTRRSILRKELIESLEVGQRLQGRVSSITNFGAFVDIGGVDGLLHVSEMSYARNKQPHELVKKGMTLEVIIKSIEKGGKRISLGHKELFDSPWTGAATKFAPDSVQKGKIVSLTDLGAFVELEPGVDGLIRPRELSWTQRIGSASEVLSVGQEIEVMVLNVNEDQERMSLSLKRAQENPWPQIVERFSGDGTWQATVKELSNKGVVVSVDGVEGFLPRGRMGRDARKLTEMKAGDTLEVRVVEIDPKRPSVIFGTPMDSGGGGGRSGGGNERGGGGRRGGRDRDRQPSGPIAPPLNELKNATNVSNFSLGDMLGDAMKEKLGLDSEPEPTPAKKDDAPAPTGEATPQAENVAIPPADTSSEPAVAATAASGDAAPAATESSTDNSTAPAATESTGDQEASSSEAPTSSDSGSETAASDAKSSDDASGSEEKTEG